MNWQKNAAWFHYGHFESKQIFLMNKKKIRHQLENQLQPYHFCPYLARKKLPHIIQALSNKIIIDNKAWDYQTTEKEVLGAYRLENPLRGRLVFLH